jgi:hypothetical protein
MRAGCRGCLQRDAERRRTIQRTQKVTAERAGERQEVERHRVAPGDAEHLRRIDLAQPLEAVEDCCSSAAPGSRTRTPIASVIMIV